MGFRYCSKDLCERSSDGNGFKHLTNIIRITIVHLIFFIPDMDGIIFKRS